MHCGGVSLPYMHCDSALWQQKEPKIKEEDMSPDPMYAEMCQVPNPLSYDTY
jgi:hypothetical protein